MTPLETQYSNNLKIKFIQEQIRENTYRWSIMNYFDTRWWYSKANESLEKRILMYK